MRGARALGGWRLLTTGLLLAGATILVVVAAIDPGHRLGWDFRGAYLPAADAVVHGRSPYPLLDSPVGRYVYPPQLALALTPLTALPQHVAILLAVLVSAGCLVGALAVLGVRDLRCYAAVFIWAPTWNELDTASVSAGLVLALALAWRYRERALNSGSALALAISTKLFLWPLLVWVLALRRLRTAAVAVVGGLALTALAWAAIGFDGLTTYPELLRRLSDLEAQQSYSFIGIASAYGLPAGAGHVLSLVVGGALLVACAACAHRGDELRSFTLSIGAALALTPILWEHFLLLLLVPLAVALPRFSPIWLVPVLLWITPRATTDPFEKVLPMLVGAVLVALLVGPPRRERRADSATVPA